MELISGLDDIARAPFPRDLKLWPFTIKQVNKLLLALLTCVIGRLSEGSQEVHLSRQQLQLAYH